MVGKNQSIDINLNLNIAGANNCTAGDKVLPPSVKEDNRFQLVIKSMLDGFPFETIYIEEIFEQGKEVVVDIKNQSLDIRENKFYYDRFKYTIYVEELITPGQTSFADIDFIGTPPMLHREGSEYYLYVKKNDPINNKGDYMKIKLHLVEAKNNQQ